MGEHHRHRCLHACLCNRPQDQDCVDCALNNPGADQAAIWAARWPGVERRTGVRATSLYARSYNNTSRYPTEHRHD